VDAARGAEPRAHPEDDGSLELSSRRTGLSFQRTRMSADRTLMSIMRTSLSLIGFGFTIFQFFRYLGQIVEAREPQAYHAARNFGLALVVLGVVLQALGIFSHVSFMWQLRRERKRLVGAGLVHGDEPFPVSVVLLTATVLVLIIGAVALMAILGRGGPFG
jgi:putative membrane protein